MQVLQQLGTPSLSRDDLNQRYASVKKSYAPIPFDWKIFTPSQLKISIDVQDKEVH